MTCNFVEEKTLQSFNILLSISLLHIGHLRRNVRILHRVLLAIVINRFPLP